MGFLLNIIASILKWILQPFCAVYGFIASIRRGELNQWGKEKALAKDRFGNVLIKYPANRYLIKRWSIDKFGDGTETISRVIGLNKHNNTLSYCGFVVDGVLEFFDPGHSLRAAGFGTRMMVPVKVLFKNKLFWLDVSMICFVVFGVIQNWFNWALTPMYISIIYPIILGIVMIIYAFIINPLKNY